MGKLVPKNASSQNVFKLVEKHKIAINSKYLNNDTDILADIIVS